MSHFAKILARAVEKHPVLYNQASQDAAKKEDYLEAWQAVSFECDKPVAVIKSRWSKTIKSLKQHLANPPPKNQARKTRSSDFQIIDELKFMVPLVGNETNSWELALNDSTDALDVKSTTSSTASTSQPLVKQLKAERHSSTDSSNECNDLTALRAAKNVPPTRLIVSNEKRKREMSKSLMNAGAAAIVENTIAGVEKKKSEAGSFFVSEPMDEVVSPVRFRRIVDEQKDKHHSATELAEPPKLAGSNKALRTRSNSMCMESKQQSDNEDESDDAEYQPPPPKRLAASKPLASASSSPRTRSNKTRVGQVGLKRIVNAAIRSPAGITRTTHSSTPSHIRSSIAALDSSPGSLLDSHDSNNEYATDLDMSMIEAAAAAAEKAEREELAYGTDAGTQCNYEADEEDDEFLERTRLWLQRMNPRQKLVFRKGVFQAFLDVYDDPRNFDIQKGTDKFVITQLNGMPALFTGMTPIELRLVRQLAIAVAGSKLNSPVVGPKYSNQDTKCKSPSMLQLAANVANRATPKLSQSSSPPSNLLSGVRHTPTEKPPAVLRTTAIALSNHTRPHSGTQRVLRKVVRVDNTNTGGNGESATHSNSNASGGNSNNNVTLARPRTVSVNTNSGNNPQRIYRILPNGNIMRHCATSGANTASTSSNSQSLSFSQPTGANTQPLSSNNRLPTTSTLTTSTGTVITTRNISKPTQSTSHTQMLVDPKTGIRRQYVTTSNGAATAVESAAVKLGRPPLSRRYSICSIPRELTQQQTEQNETMRWPAIGALGSQPQKLQPKLSMQPNAAAATSAAAAAAAAGGTPKPIVRVRYAQNQSISPVSSTNAARASGSNQFALPAAVSPRKQQQSSPLSNDAPIPVSISSSSNTNAADNSEAILKRAQQVYENALMLNDRVVQNNAETTAAAIAGRRSTESCPLQEDKSNCLITSDMISNFIVKNEPFDQDEDEMNADFLD